MSHIIKRLQIEKLFGTTNIDWELNPSVNVLVGQNGLGKSTILRIINATLTHERISDFELINKCELIFEDGKKCLFTREFKNQQALFDKLIKQVSEAEEFKLDLQADSVLSEDSVIEKRSFSFKKEKLQEVRDRLKTIFLEMQEESLSGNISSFTLQGDIKAEEDITIEFISTINMSANSINSLTTSSGQHTTLLDIEIDNEIQRLLAFNDDILKQKLLSSLNTLFAETHKTIEFSKNKLAVKLANGDTIPFSKLSSGERQVIFIFLKVVIASVDSALILMDEPEISLHLSWQEKLLNEIRKVNATSQIIIVTHSPAMLMNGWMDSFVDITNIMTDVSSPVT